MSMMVYTIINKIIHYELVKKGNRLESLFVKMTQSIISRLKKISFVWFLVHNNNRNNGLYT